MARYDRAQRVAMESHAAVQIFNIEFRNATVGYFRDNPDAEKLTLKDTLLFAPKIPSLSTRRGFNPDLSRYPRTLSFYAQYVLPAGIRHNIAFGISTDQAFLDYLKNPDRKVPYRVLIPLLE